nr:hypothetical protein CFP56_75540 [Quercus suber]
MLAKNVADRLICTREFQISILTQLDQVLRRKSQIACDRVIGAEIGLRSVCTFQPLPKHCVNTSLRIGTAAACRPKDPLLLLCAMRCSPASLRPSGWSDQNSVASLFLLVAPRALPNPQPRGLRTWTSPDPRTL